MHIFSEIIDTHPISCPNLIERKIMPQNQLYYCVC
jgi:hypothetical protein